VRLTYGGYDFLACRTFAKRDTIYSVGNQIGTGKESGQFSLLLSPPRVELHADLKTTTIDIYVVADEDGTQMVMKIQRCVLSLPFFLPPRR
jgi:RIO kinase 2